MLIVMLLRVLPGSAARSFGSLGGRLGSQVLFGLGRSGVGLGEVTALHPADLHALVGDQPRPVDAPQDWSR